MAELTIAVPRSDDEVEPQNTLEFDRVSAVRFDCLAILTPHGLAVSGQEMGGMEHAMTAVLSAVDAIGKPMVLETHPAVFKIARTAGLIVRPSYWTYEVAVKWVEYAGDRLVKYFGQGCQFRFIPEYHDYALFVSVRHSTTECNHEQHR